MAELRIVPGELDLTVWRGDSPNIEITITDDETNEPLVLPTTGWRAHVREDEDSELLFSIPVIATSAGSGLVILAVDGADTAAQEEDVLVWDIENTETKRTYLAGAFNLDGEVSR